MKKKDLYWLFGYPIYQLIGTFRHEASHALVAWLQGAQITEFVFWPTVGEAGFFWGYVRWVGQTDWLVTAAPYIVDLLTFGIFLVICLRLLFPARWIWLNVVILGVVSPLINSFYNYWGSERGQNDVSGLFEILPRSIVHGYFAITMVLYIGGLILLFTMSKRSRADRQRGSLSFDLAFSTVH